MNHTGHDWFEHTTLGNLRSDTQLALVRIPTIVIGAVLAPLPFLKRVVTAIHRDQVRYRPPRSSSARWNGRCSLYMSDRCLD